MRYTEERYISLLDKQTHKVFNDKLTFKYVEIAKFKKSIEELKNNYDKWIYVLQNLSRLDRQPRYLQTAVFTRLFKQAEIAGFTRTELREYEDSLKAYRDMKNSLDNAEEKGVVKGERNKAIEIATKMKAKGFSVDDIVQMTGLSADEVKKIKH